MFLRILYPFCLRLKHCFNTCLLFARKEYFMCSVYCTQISPLAVSKSSNLLKEIVIELIQNTSSSPICDYLYKPSVKFYYLLPLRSWSTNYQFWRIVGKKPYCQSVNWLNNLKDILPLLISYQATICQNHAFHRNFQMQHAGGGVIIVTHDIATYFLLKQAQLYRLVGLQSCIQLMKCRQPCTQLYINAC